MKPSPEISRQLTPVEHGESLVEEESSSSQDYTVRDYQEHLKNRQRL
jgi:hypothetical protein